MSELSNTTEEEIERILYKSTNPYRSSYTQVNGCTLPTAFKYFREDIYNFEVFDDDIWICSYPKTGTTWISELVWLIANHFDYEKAKKSVFERIRFIELSMLFYTASNPKGKIDEAIDDSVNYTKKQPRPRFIKTHLQFQFFPKQIQSGEKRPKIIYITRNPIDACISYYYHSSSMGYSGTLEEFCKLYTSNKMCYGTFWDNVLPFWRMRDQPNVLFLRFEDMKKDLPKVIHQTAAFLGHSVPQEEMENLQKHLSFEAMKNNTAVNGGKILEFLKSLGKVGSPHIRSGQVGGYKNELPPNYISHFQKWINDNTAGTGLTF